MSRYFQSKGSSREYIVVKHQLPGVNLELLGVRYRDGYGVVAKNSKEHLNLRRVKMAIDIELPITFLPKVKSVINTRQIKSIWGSDVYRYYLEQLAKDENRPVELQNITPKPYCNHEHDGKRCGNQSLRDFTFCRKHIEEDLKLKPFIRDMKMMPKKEKKDFIDNAIDKARSS